MIEANYRIKQIRKKRGDTLKNLAQKINYDFSNLSKIERGIYQPSLPLLKRIAAVYNVDLDYFLDLHQYSQKEQESKYYLELDSKKSLEEYHLNLDGRELTESELNFAIEIIRKLRSAFNEEAENNH